VVIPPGETLNIIIRCSRPAPGPYRAEVPIYTDAPGQMIITLTIEGSFVPADESSASSTVERQ
jgi:hypothetical protein